MHVFEIVIALLLAGAGLTSLARWLGAPYPSLLALAGAALALVPGTPTLVLDPNLALALFVAPVLLDSAFDASQRDLRTHWRAVAGLAIGAVLLTVLAVALAARWLVPDLPWAAAVALGAIVAPPDAAAAAAVLRHLKLPNHLLVILEGESLFNDASALLIYRLAVGAAVAGEAVGWGIVPAMLLATVGSLVLGMVMAPLMLGIARRIHDVPTSVIFQFCGTFAVWILAERLELSGILTTVAYAMATSRRAANIMPARIRVPSYAVWEVAVFVLNVLAFILVGFQLKGILQRSSTAELAGYASVAAAVCATAVVARMVWVLGVAAVARATQRGRVAERARASVALTPAAATLVGWSGMRGIVTLAAALALPAATGGAVAFPYRDLILFTSFAVVVVTLVVQGLTLRPLLAHLAFEDDPTIDQEVRLARIETLRAGMAAADAAPESETTVLLCRRYALQLQRAEREGGGKATEGEVAGDPESGPGAQAARSALTAERQRLIALRDEGRIGDAAFQRIEEELDMTELDLQHLLELDSVGNPISIPGPEGTNG